jgi:hypothetical protein
MMSLKSIVRRWERETHDRRCAGILATAPLSLRPAPVKILSMVCHRDVILYLVAAKSFYRRLDQGSFVLIDDGSLTEEDRSIFRAHLGAPLIVPIASVFTHGCPRGGTWERLVRILELARQDYVIQLDADTLTLGEMDDVRACVAANRSFTLGTNTGRDFVSAWDAAKLAQSKPGDHLQDVAERAMDRLRDAKSRRYVRGCSGFAGFARESGGLDLVCDFSSQMASMLKERWTEWGSEQVASNFAVANAPDAMVLPYPAYGSFERSGDPGRFEFLHFIGSNRYDGGVYTRLSRGFIRSLAAPSVSNLSVS